jgi:hypothetical protein
MRAPSPPRSSSESTRPVRSTAPRAAPGGGLRLAAVATTALACGGSSAPVGSGSAATSAPAAGSGARPASRAPATLRLAGVAPLPGAPAAGPLSDAARAAAFGPGFTPDGASVVMVAGDALHRYAVPTLAASAGRRLAPTRALAGPATVLPGLAAGDAAIDAAAGARLRVPPPPGLECEPPALSATAARLSRVCAGPDDAVVIVQEARSGAVLARLTGPPTAAPVRAGEITASGTFVLWTARASGALQAIATQAIGPTISSRAALSPDDHALITVPDRRWVSDPDATAQLVDPRTAEPRYALPAAVDRVHFAPDSQRFAAVHVGGEGEVTAVTIHRTADGAAVAQLPAAEVADAELVVFAPDARAVVVRGARALRFYTGVP